MKSLNIFIVDDNKDLAEGMAMLLQIEGHRVTLAYSGEQALKIFKQQDFDITFMDVKMPGMNGVESFFEIRKIKPDAKVMMMTAYSVKELLQQAIDGGAMGVLDKPVEPEKIKKILESVKPAGIILVADDDADFVASLEMNLNQSGYSVLVSHDGQQAVERVLQNDIDVLVLDLRLPVLSGLEVYMKLKQQNHSLPTLIVTGYAAEESEALTSLKALSVAGCLIKPFPPEVLLDAIENIMVDT